MKRYGPLALLLLAYLVAGTLYAANTPDWQAPDEPAHYNYVRQLAEGRWPVIEPGDYDQAYQSEVVSSQFDPAYSVEPFEYEDYQPPLYYLLQTPVFWLFGGRLLALRLTSVLLGAGVVLLAYLIGRRLFEEQDWLALTAAAFVALLPQHVAMLASVNNDSLAELFIAAILLVLVDLVQGVNSHSDNLGQQREWPRRHLLGLGLLLGLGFLTKATVYLMVPVIALALLWLYREQGRSLLRSGALVFAPAVALGLPWWVRNVAVYPGLDAMGIAAHNRIVVGQPRTAEWIAERGLGGTLQAFFQTTFQSFWGQFGWMGVVMPSWVYRLLLLFSVATLAGLAWHAWRLGRGRGESYRARPGRSTGLAWALLVGTLVLSVLLYLGYNLTFVQHQGRYLFSALVPIGLGVAVAWGALLAAVSRRWPWVAFLIPLGLALALFGLDLLALFRFVVPSLG